MNKYHNLKIIVKGKTFDSKKEAKRYSELLEQEERGEISGLKTQVKFELIPKQKGERACTYIADFVYKDPEQNLVVEDVKGSPKTLTEVYRIKKKLMLQVHKIKVKEIY